MLCTTIHCNSLRCLQDNQHTRRMWAPCFADSKHTTHTCLQALRTGQPHMSHTITDYLLCLRTSFLRHTIYSLCTPHSRPACLHKVCMSPASFHLETCLIRNIYMTMHHIQIEIFLPHNTRTQQSLLCLHTCQANTHYILHCQHAMSCLRRTACKSRSQTENIAPVDKKCNWMRHSMNTCRLRNQCTLSHLLLCPPNTEHSLLDQQACSPANKHTPPTLHCHSRKQYRRR